MRYFFISDVHGEYEKMLSALTDAGFDMEKDTLVSVGDPFDRGPQSKEVVDYFMKCPHRILIEGNHDMRLQELMQGKDAFKEFDISNGICATLVSFSGLKGMDMYTQLAKVRTYEPLRQYFREICHAIEFDDLIATHAWLPTYYVYDTAGGYKKLKLMENWREDMTHYTWYEYAVWANTERCVNLKLYPEKTLLIGHWHAWRLAEHFMEKRFTDRHLAHPQIDCSTFIYKDKLIAIDGMSNYEKGGCVNVYIYNSEKEPIIYR